ncbi:MAG: hypothetical protein KC553_00595 [Nitrospina sp.]|nr:hypothetical protein [Nitrospina sp.]
MEGQVRLIEIKCPRCGFLQVFSSTKEEEGVVKFPPSGGSVSN